MKTTANAAHISQNLREELEEGLEWSGKPVSIGGVAAASVRDAIGDGASGAGSVSVDDFTGHSKWGT